MDCHSYTPLCQNHPWITHSYTLIPPLMSEYLCTLELPLTVLEASMDSHCYTPHVRVSLYTRVTCTLTVLGPSVDTHSYTPYVIVSPYTGVTLTVPGASMDSKKRMTAISSQKNWFTAIWSTKKWIPAIWKLKTLVHSYFDPEKLFHSYLEREKSGSLLFGDQTKSLLYPGWFGDCQSNSGVRGYFDIGGYSSGYPQMVRRLSE